MLGPEESRVNKANDHYYYQQTSCVIHPRAISLPQLSAPASNLQASHANQGEDSSHLLPGLRGGEGLWPNLYSVFHWTLETTWDVNIVISNSRQEN